MGDPSAPVHRRSVSIESSPLEHEGEPALLLRGRLTDERETGEA